MSNLIMLKTLLP